MAGSILPGPGFFVPMILPMSLRLVAFPVLFSLDFYAAVLDIGCFGHSHSPYAFWGTFRVVVVVFRIVQLFRLPGGM